MRIVGNFQKISTYQQNTFFSLKFCVEIKNRTSFKETIFKMWCNLRDKFLVLLIVLLSLQLANACCSSNSTALIPLGADDVFFGMPVYYKSNMPIKKFYSKSQMENHIQQILKPLSPFIMGRDSRNNRNTRAIQRRQDTQVGTVPTIVELYEFKFPYIAAAQIGDYTFT